MKRIKASDTFSRKSYPVKKTDVQKKRAETKAIIDELEALGINTERPKTRAQCPKERPCPFVSCRYNLALDVRDSGSITENFYGQDIEHMSASCALDVADEHPEGMSLTKIGGLMNITRERVRQIEVLTLEKMRAK